VARIIAGDAGSLTLKVPQGPTRPTSDRVREAMFSSLSHRIDFDGVAVLDLYAGSGALGFEALSRGASRLIAVDSDRGAMVALKANQRTISSALTRDLDISLRQQSVTAFIDQNSALGEIDLVFIDPPYALPNTELESLLVSLSASLGPDALVVVERSAKDPTPLWSDGMKCVTEKTYGDTAVFTLELSR